MLRNFRATVRSLPANIVRAGLVLITVTVTGTAGYMIFEGWPFLDALYMTIIVITTIGFGEVRPLDDSGRIFTIALAVFGVGGIFYALIAVFSFLVEGELGAILGVQRMKSQIEQLRGHYILCGFGRVGEEIAREFAGRDITFVVVEITPEAIERAQKRGYPLLVGDGTSDEVLREAGVERARCLLAASDSDADNTFIILTAKALNPSIYVVARAAHPDSQPRMLRAGADRVFSPYVTAGWQMAVSALQPSVVEFIDTLATGQAGERILAEIDVSADSGFVGQTIEQALRENESILVLGIRRRSGEVLVGPAPETSLQPGDRVIVMGADAELEAIQAEHTHRKGI
jgi:voltage-gated potassium channel